jgi:predicted ATP-dependent endonuclease of OLD family
MTEKLIVKNFAGIQELEIEVKRINILIGPQASGKSVCAKLLYYFKSFIWKIFLTVENEQTKDELKENYIRTFEEFFPPDAWGKEPFSIKYEIAGICISVEKTIESERIDLSYGEYFDQEFDALAKVLTKWLEDGENIDDYNFYDSKSILKQFISSAKTHHLPDEIAFSQLFIPAGRSFFANLQSSIFSFLSNNNNLDPFLKAFGSSYENMKRPRLKRLNPKNYHAKTDEEKDLDTIQEAIKQLVEKTLCGKHVPKGGKDFLELADGRRVSIANSSSGQQEMLPLTISLASLPFGSQSLAGQTVYIEEPEAHLFPDAQRDVVELIATVFNYRKGQLQFFITTHSPYMLTSINNLIQAGTLYRESEESILNQLEEIVPRYKALELSDISAYLLANGRCQDIIDFEMDLVDASMIDDVSDELAIEFDKLLDLSYIDPDQIKE